MKVRRFIQIDDIKWKRYRIDEVDWFCDGCNDCLNYQDGFDELLDDLDDFDWKCTECGFNNRISEENILGNDEIDDLPNYSETEYFDEDNDQNDTMHIHEMSEKLEELYNHMIEEFHTLTGYEDDEGNEHLDDDYSENNELDFELDFDD